MSLFEAFVDDAAMFPPARVPLEQAVAEHRAHRSSAYAALLGGFVVSDAFVADLTRAVGLSAGSVSDPLPVPLLSSLPAPLPINLVVTGGAGAIEPAVTWVSRTPGLALRAIEFGLRGEEDLAHNAQRLIHVIDSLEDSMEDSFEDVIVFAEPPMLHGPAPRGWLSALDELATREFHLKFRTGGLEHGQVPSPVALATCIESALDRELPFKTTAGLHHTVRHRDEATGGTHHGFLNVLVATRASLDGSSSEEVAGVLEETDGAVLAAQVTAAPEVAERTRRWFTSFGSCSVMEAHKDLVELGLL